MQDAHEVEAHDDEQDTAGLAEQGQGNAGAAMLRVDPQALDIGRRFRRAAFGIIAHPQLDEADLLALLLGDIDGVGRVQREQAGDLVFQFLGVRVRPQFAAHFRPGAVIGVGDRADKHVRR